MKFSLRAICTVLLIALSPASAWSGAETEEKAFALFQEARISYEKGDLQQSMVQLEEAWKLFEHPVIALQLSEILEKLGQPERALSVLKSVASNDPELKSKLRLRTKALQSFLSQPLKVSIFSNVPNTTIVIDGNERRNAPVEIELERGDHELTAIATGYRRIEQTIQVKGSTDILVKLEMQALTGTLSVQTIGQDLSEMKIRVDGQTWKLRPHELTLQQTQPRSLQVGKHELTCWRKGEEKDVRSFAVREGEDVVLICRSGLATQNTTRRIWGWLSASGSIASAAAGGVLFWSYRKDIEKEQADPLLYIKSTNKHIFAGVFGLASIGLGITSYFLFNSTDMGNQSSLHSHARGNWQLIPVMSDGFRGISALKRF